MIDEKSQLLTIERNNNSVLQAKVMEAEKQVKDSFIEIEKLREQHRYDIAALTEKLDYVQTKYSKLIEAPRGQI